jgi:curved DNA-binding protein CbpA
MEKKGSFVDYYHVLRVWPTASEDAIKKAYFQMAKLYHPDVVSKGGEQSTDDGIDFKLINEAYAVLSDPMKRQEYDERLKGQGKKDPSTAIPEADKRSAQMAFEQAKAAMRHNRYDKAVVLLKSAIKYDDSNPAYHSWYGFSLGALRTRLHEARDSCKRALEMEFYNADYHSNLGYVYMQAGLKSTAKECFKEALKWDPDHPLALRYLNPEEQKKGKNLLRTVLAFVTGNSAGNAPNSGKV